MARQNERNILEINPGKFTKANCWGQQHFALYAVLFRSILRCKSKEGVAYSVNGLMKSIPFFSDAPPTCTFCRPLKSLLTLLPFCCCCFIDVVVNEILFLSLSPCMP